MEYYLVGLLASDIQHLEHIRKGEGGSSPRPEMLSEQATQHINKLSRVIEDLYRLPSSEEITNSFYPSDNSQA